MERFDEDLLDEDTMTSCRPYQDVIAINELADLDSFDVHRRRRFAPEKEERFPWLREIRPEDDFKRFFRPKVCFRIGQARVMSIENINCLENGPTRYNVFYDIVNNFIKQIDHLKLNIGEHEIM